MISLFRSKEESLVILIFYSFVIQCGSESARMKFDPQSSESVAALVNILIGNRTFNMPETKFSNDNWLSLENPHAILDSFERPLRTEGMPRSDNRNNFGVPLQSSFLRPKPRCNKRIRIANGVTRFRDRGSFVRYACSHGYTLLGATVAVCLRDQWSEPPPICVKPGCRRIQEPRNGAARTTFGGALVSFFCSKDYQLEGNLVIFCDGNRWNGTEPVCFATQPPEVTTEEPEEPTWDVTNYTESEMETTENLEAWDFYVATSSTKASLPVSTDIANTPSTPYAQQGNNHSDLTVEPATSSIYGPSNHDWDQAIQVPSSVSPPIIEHKNSEPTGQPSMPTLSVEVLTKSIATNPTTDIPIITYPPTQVMTSPVPISTMTENPAIIHTITTIPITRSNRWQRMTTKPSKLLTMPTTTKRPLTTVKSTSTPTTPTSTTTENAVKSTERLEEPFPDHTFDKFDEELGFSYNFDNNEKSPELIQPILPISPHKLDDEKAHERYRQIAHGTLIGGTILGILGSVALVGGITVYCWRKNHGIARAHPYDIDGRTLSANEANDDFMWMVDSRDSSTRL